MYESYFADMTKKISEKIEQSWPDAYGKGEAFRWVGSHHIELAEREKKWWKELGDLWDANADFDKFKKAVLEWGRAVLCIYKAYHEGISHGNITRD